jgi:hypothetical protein
VIHTLVYAKGPIVAFAEDGDHLAWATDAQCVVSIRIRSLSRRTQRVVGQVPPGDCSWIPQTRIALAGDRALWTYYDAGNEQYTYLNTAALTGTPPALVTYASWDTSGYGIGEQLGGLAGQGELLVYSLVSVSVHGADNCDRTQTCTSYVKGGSVTRLETLKPQGIPGTPPAMQLAVSGNELAIVPAGVVRSFTPTRADATIAAEPNGPVQVRNAATGGLLSSFAPTGAVTAIAVSGPTVAVLVTAHGTKRIERYAASSGKLLGATPVPPFTADELSMDASRIIFHVGRSIRAVNDSSGAAATIFLAAATPIGLSIDHGRIAWGETVRAKGKTIGRINTIQLTRT